MKRLACSRDKWHWDAWFAATHVEVHVESNVTTLLVNLIELVRMIPLQPYMCWRPTKANDCYPCLPELSQGSALMYGCVFSATFVNAQIRLYPLARQCQLSLGGKGMLLRPVHNQSAYLTCLDRLDDGQVKSRVAQVPVTARLEAL